MTNISRNDLETSVDIVGTWINDDTRNYAALADMLRGAQLSEQVVGVVVLELMSASKLSEWRTILSSLVGRELSSQNEIVSEQRYNNGSNTDVWDAGYVKWEARYSAAPTDTWSFGNEPVPEVRRAVNFYRYFYGEKPATVVDLGAGDGRNSIYLAKAGFDVIAVDAAQSGLDKIAERAEEHEVSIKIVAADLRDYEPPMDIDIVVASYIIHLLPNPQSFLDLWAAAVRHEGFIAISGRGRMGFDPPEYWFPPAGMLAGYYGLLGCNILATREETEYRPNMGMFRHTGIVARKVGG